MAFWVSEEVLSVIVPPLLYWLSCGFYALISPADKHRLFPKDAEDTKNLVTKREVIRGVLLNQALQIPTLMLLQFASKGSSSSGPTSLLVWGRQLFVALVVQDTWQYWIHRLLHTNKFLYKHVHEKHHRLVVPYVYGAMYNHPVEGYIVDTLGAAAGFLLSGMSLRTATFFYGLSIVKVVDDHSGMWFPNSPFHRFLSNNTAFHAVHHQFYGAKFNYSVPFFSVWDRLMGTYLPYVVEEGQEGGYQIRPIKD